jgi:hypothetical protein
VDNPGRLMVSALPVAEFQRAITVLLVPKSIEIAMGSSETVKVKKLPSLYAHYDHCYR